MFKLKTNAEYLSDLEKQHDHTISKINREKQAVLALPSDIEYSTLCVHEKHVSLIMNFRLVQDLPSNIVTYIEELLTKLPPEPRFFVVRDGSFVSSCLKDQIPEYAKQTFEIGPVTIQYHQAPSYNGDEVRIDWYTKSNDILFHVQIDLPPLRYRDVLGQGTCTVKYYAGGRGEVASASNAKALTPFKPYYAVHYAGGSSKDPGFITVCLPPNVSFIDAIKPNVNNKPEAGWNSRDFTSANNK